MKPCFKSHLIVAVICTVFSVVGCSSEQNKGMTLLDAAALYEANPAAFGSVRASYPGPFTKFSRVPARDPAKATAEEKRFVKTLRQIFSFEYIDFFPYGDTGKDEIDVILARYGIDADWTVVSVVYSGIPLPIPEEGLGIGMFDVCDQRAIDWFEADHEPGPVSAFCKINESWYAHQVVN